MEPSRTGNTLSYQASGTPTLPSSVQMDGVVSAWMFISNTLVSTVQTQMPLLPPKLLPLQCSGSATPLAQT